MRRRLPAVETVLFLSYAVVGSVAPLMYAGRRSPGGARLAELMLVVLGVVYAPFAAVCLTEGQATSTCCSEPPRRCDACSAVAGCRTARLRRLRRGGADPDRRRADARDARRHDGGPRGEHRAERPADPVAGAATAAALATTVAYAVEAAIGLGVAARWSPGCACWRRSPRRSSRPPRWRLPSRRCRSRCWPSSLSAWPCTPPCGGRPRRTPPAGAPGGRGEPAPAGAGLGVTRADRARHWPVPPAGRG